MWRSKADVINDLPECSVFGSDFDESHIVRGTGAPLPQRHKDIDEEMELMFGDRFNRPSFNRSSSPDLKAITEMLRMVDSYDKPEEKQPEQSKKCPNTIVVISKLNPDVKEFVPSSVEVRDRQTQATAAINLETKMMSSHDDPKEASEKTKTPKEEIIDNSMAEYKQDEVKLKEIEHQLKNKITSTTKPATLQQKRDRNVAIAALMRLKTGASTPSKSSTSTVVSNSPQPKLESPNITDIHVRPTKSSIKPVELLTPKYFEGPSCSPRILDVDEHEHMIPVPKPLLEPPKLTASPQEMQDPQMKESIDKVNKWLNPEVKAKTSPLAPHNGTVLFKKKESVSGSAKSPCSGRSQKSMVEYVPPPPPEFIPSSYAEELKKKFEERVKANEDIARKNQPPPDKLKTLEDIGISFTFKRRQ